MFETAVIVSMKIKPNTQVAFNRARRRHGSKCQIVCVGVVCCTQQMSEKRNNLFFMTKGQNLKLKII